MVAPSSAARRIDLAGETMGTNWSLAGYLDADDEFDVETLRDVIEVRFALWVDVFSTWTTDSFVGRYNRATAGMRFDTGPEFEGVMARAVVVADASDGAFNPFLGGAIAAAGFGAPLLRAGEPVAWEDAREFVAGDGLVQPGGLQLDLSAIAKGAAVDDMARWARAAGMTSFLAEIGGEFVGEGVKPDGLPWWVEIEAPGGGGAEWRIAACGVSVATSGDAYAVRDEAGDRASHVVAGNDARDATLRSVTVVHEECALADAWATALFASGPAGPDLAERRGITALFLHDGGRAVLSAAARAMLDD